MQKALFNVRISKWNDPVHLYCIGDFHIGHINHDYEKLQEIKDMIMSDPYAQVLIMGDNVDGRMPDHKFFELENVDPTIKLSKFIANCYKRFEDFIIDISPKCLGTHCGNHELKVNSVAPYIENICERRQCAFLGYRALSILKIESSCHKANRTYRIFSTHGSGGGRKSGSKINRIEDEAQSSRCDIFIQGHNHLRSFTDGIVHEPVLHRRGISIIERPQAFINSGSFLKSYQVDNYNYSEKASYKPQPTGGIKLIIDPVKNTFKGLTI
jgi:hypothetical protein